MKSSLKIILSVLIFANFGCVSHLTKAHSLDPGKANSPVGRNEEEGQIIRWEKQGITFTLPRDWRRDDSHPEDQKRNNTFTNSGLVWRGPDNQKIEFNIETGEIDFPVSEREMLAADYKTNQSSKDTIKDSHYEEIGGLNGIYSRVAGDEERINVWWTTYRHYKGKAQSIGVNLVGPGKDTDVLMTILKSIKLEHD